MIDKGKSYVVGLTPEWLSGELVTVLQRNPATGLVMAAVDGDIVFLHASELIGPFEEER